MTEVTDWPPNYPSHALTGHVAQSEAAHVLRPDEVLDPHVHWKDEVVEACNTRQALCADHEARHVHFMRCHLQQEMHVSLQAQQ